ncbi:unnamed protein product [Calypogeia fissa]
MTDQKLKEKPNPNLRAVRLVLGEWRRGEHSSHEVIGSEPEGGGGREGQVVRPGRLARRQDGDMVGRQAGQGRLMLPGQEEGSGGGLVGAGSSGTREGNVVRRGVARGQRLAGGGRETSSGGEQQRAWELGSRRAHWGASLPTRKRARAPPPPPPPPAEKKSSPVAVAAGRPCPRPGQFFLLPGSSSKGRRGMAW